MLTRLRKTLVAGIVVMVPIVVTIKVLEILFKFTDGILGNALTKLLKVHIPGLGLLLFVILIYITGLVTRTFFGKNSLRWVEQMIDKRNRKQGSFRNIVTSRGQTRSNGLVGQPFFNFISADPQNSHPIRPDAASHGNLFF